MNKSVIGVFGLGVMGKSLARNMASRNFEVSVYNRTVKGIEEGIVDEFISKFSLPNLHGYNELETFINSLEKPRKILIMIKAGAGIDHVIESLLPHLDEGDVILDAGNSHYKDSQRRYDYLNQKGIEFLGTGVSGGEEGALKGPSIMPGGSEKGYLHTREILEAIAATDSNQLPCCTYIGKGGSGHFVKMIHNGIEYAEMQFLAEVYALLSGGNALHNEDIAKVLEAWSGSNLNSYLLEITIDILRFKSQGGYLLDKILDAAEQKGTGGWSTEAALELGVPFSVISDAVMARLVSSKKALRTEIAIKRNAVHLMDIDQLKSAYAAVRMINHAIGIEVIHEASIAYKWDLNMSEVARIWTNGCIIRSTLMQELVEDLKSSPSLWRNKSIMNRLAAFEPSLAELISSGAKSGIPLPGFSSAYNHYLGMTTANSAANMIQAQRDYFGAHTYQRTDKPPTEYFHTEWLNK